ncbi:Predicted dehydrogenase [Fictibacillus enclensis]|uniref:Oxidoreductase n=1 Tax=Fictibacillus enclensis TaxID=1017270 RepID=A0A0V8J0U0_9BACL|nr:Gfo/Idh/MocA family oxidoreductase [Fictibacillus enclensis]KSU80384.1 oxidoreductase [Fictibacillus enclensis]SCC38727.1 Predicted dehydrogenase [Fictibacillus enclensis]
MKKINIGLIGCGVISDIYLKNCSSYDHLEVVAVSDLDQKRAEEKAQQYNIPSVLSVDELIHHEDIDIVLNLTPPGGHYALCLQALNAGKHVYVEKPLSVSVPEAQELIDTANEKGLLIGAAPDTFLGAGLQTCRALIEDGAIGQPVAATAFMMSRGPEQWHPSPAFFYQAGGGPMYDMGPYYLTAFISMLGPVKRVTASAGMPFLERTIMSGEDAGKKIPVHTPTHISGNVEFESGAVGTIITSFDVQASRLPFIEIYGTEGTISVPDPNTFGGPVVLKQKGSDEWVEQELVSETVENSRGIGIADMADAILEKRPHRASGEQAFHVLEIMHGFHEAASLGKHYDMQSTYNRPAGVNETLVSGGNQ